MEKRVDELETQVHQLETKLAVSQTKVNDLKSQVHKLWDKYDAVTLIISEVKDAVVEVHAALLKHAVDEAGKQNTMLYGILGTLIILVINAVIHYTAQ